MFLTSVIPSVLYYKIIKTAVGADLISATVLALPNVQRLFVKLTRWSEPYGTTRGCSARIWSEHWTNQHTAREKIQSGLQPCQEPLLRAEGLSLTHHNRIHRHDRICCQQIMQYGLGADRPTGSSHLWRLTFEKTKYARKSSLGKLHYCVSV